MHQFWVTAPQNFRINRQPCTQAMPTGSLTHRITTGANVLRGIQQYSAVLLITPIVPNQCKLVNHSCHFGTSTVQHCNHVLFNWGPTLRMGQWGGSGTSLVLWNKHNFAMLLLKQGSETDSPRETTLLTTDTKQTPGVKRGVASCNEQNW